MGERSGPDEEDNNLVTLAAALRACWPTEITSKYEAIRAIRDGEVARLARAQLQPPSQKLACPAEEGGRDGAHPSGIDDVDWRVERQPGKRNVGPQDWLLWRGEQRQLPPPLWVMLHKPADCVTSMAEKEGRTVYDVLTHPNRNLRAVGRLDRATEGLLLFTTHGREVKGLLCPGARCAKRYRCWLEQPADAGHLATLLRGGLCFRDAKAEGGLAAALPALAAEIVQADLDSGDIAQRAQPHCVVDLTIEEGRYHQVRRMWEALGNRVVRLQRLQFGPVALGGLAAGEWRELCAAEVAALTRCA